MTAIALVSAIVPLFNGCRFICEAINSIFAQELKPREIVVVEDGSTDGGHYLLTSYLEIILVS